MSAEANRVLTLIDSNILKQQQTSVVKYLVKDVIDCVIKASYTFEYFYSYTVYTGSRFDGLSITENNIYDVNIVLALPDPCTIDVFYKDAPYGYTLLQVEPLSKLRSLGDAYYWADEEGFLKPEQMRKWLEDKLEVAFSSMPRSAYNYNERNFNGHGIMISGDLIKFNNSKSFDGEILIRLIPTFELPIDSLPNTKRLRYLRKKIHFDDYWYPIPQEPISDCDSDLSEICWIINCDTQEDELIHHMYNLKPTIRLFKLFRDEQLFKGVQLSSYCVKTLFFWEIEKHNFDHTFWQRKSVAELFSNMLKIFLEHINDNVIQNFWFPQQEIILCDSTATFNSWKDRVKNMLDYINNDDECENYIAEYLLSDTKLKYYKSLYDFDESDESDESDDNIDYGDSSSSDD